MSKPKADRYQWTCPLCEKSYRVKVGHAPDCCPKCAETSTYRPGRVPDPPEWLKNRIEQKAAFVPTDRRREERSKPSEAYAPSIEFDTERTRWQGRRKTRSVTPWWLWTYLLWCALFVFVAFGPHREEPFAENARLFILGVTVAPMLLVAYMIPTIIAASRKHHNVIPIGIINFCFGWLLVGFVVSMAWAFSSPAKYEHVHHYHER